MGTILIVALEIALFVGVILILDLVKVKHVPVKVRVDSDKKNR